MAKKFKDQGVVVSPKRRHTTGMLSIGRPRTNAGGRPFDDTLMARLNKEEHSTAKLAKNQNILSLAAGR